MGSFARPKGGDPEAGKKPLPELRPAAVARPPTKGSAEKRARLEALRRKCLEPEKVAREIAAAQRAAAMSRRRLPQTAPAPVPAAGGSRPPSGDEPPLDWRLLSACKAVADAENDDRRKAENKRKAVDAARIISVQLDENARYREQERRRREEVKREAQADARRAAAAELAEKVSAREKKIRDRKMFDEQAKAYAAQQARQRAAEEAAEQVEVDAAKQSLLAEDRKNARLKKSFQAEQERLAQEIVVSRKHKEQQKLADWRENARIDREARETQDERERRRALVKAQRNARIERFRSRVEIESFHFDTFPFHSSTGREKCRV
jgi:colicin import membrane protein